MTTLAARIAVVLVFLASAVYGAEKPAYAFTLNGKPAEVRFFSRNGTPETPGPGDVAYVNQAYIQLDDPGVYDLSTDKSKPRLLFRRSAPGVETLIWAAVSWDYEKDGKSVANSLADLTDAQVKSLRGIYLGVWNESIAKDLARLDASHCAFTVGGRLTDDSAFPPLPAPVRCLFVEADLNSPLKWSNLARLTQLELFSIRWGKELDLKLLPPTLRYLQLYGEQRDISPLSRLTELRTLDLAWAKGLEDLGAIAKLSRLRTLDVRQTDACNIAALADHPALVELLAAGSMIDRLPRGKMPALKRCGLYGAPVAAAEVATFRQNNPAARVDFEWANGLRAQAAKTDRIHVRTGGTGRHAGAHETTLFEVKDAAEVAAFFDKLAIDEPNSNGACFCGGNPTIEFYSGDQLLAMVSYHHGTSLRWDQWPADASLTAASTDWLVDWMDKNGYDGPRKERDKERERARARARRWTQYEAVLPKPLLEGIAAAKSDVDSAKLFVEKVPDLNDRAALCLKLLAGHEGPWNEYDQIESLIFKQLTPALQGNVDATLAKAATDDTLVPGTAWWLLGEAKHIYVGRETLDKITPAIAAYALSEPVEENRRHAIGSLFQIASGPARAALRQALAGKIAVRKGPTENKAGFMIEVGPDALKLDEPKAETTLAARLLADLGDRESLPLIEALVAKASPEDKKILAAAIASLKKEKSPASQPLKMRP